MSASAILSSRWLDPRRSRVPALFVFLVGLALFLVDAAVNPRPGPIAYLLTPTPVAVLLSLSLRPIPDRRRLLLMTAWGFLGTTAAGVGTVIIAIGTRLPRPYEAWELFILDVGVFLWFIVALAGAFVVAGRTRGWRATVALLAGPVAQLAGFLLFIALTAEDIILVAVT